MNKEFTHVVEDLPKVESKLDKESVKQQQRATQTSITSFFGDVLGKIFLLCIKTFNRRNLVSFYLLISSAK